MSNLYIDHSVVSREQSWPDLKQVIEEGNLKLTLSLWNLVEIGNAGDLAQRGRRLEFLEQFNPLWIVERVDVQRQEVKRFLWTEHFRTKPEDLSVFVPRLSMVDASHIGWRMRVGLTPREWIEGIDFAQIEANKTLAPNALKILQDVGAAQVKKRQHEIFKRWIKPLIPDVGPSGNPLTRVQMEELLELCYERRAAFFIACKSLAVEDALTTARSADPSRKPKKSDGIDLMHSIVALAYCDYFIVPDSYVHSCAVQAVKALGSLKLAAVYDDPTTMRQSAVRCTE
jgi:hypothetical protein